MALPTLPLLRPDNDKANLDSLYAYLEELRSAFANAVGTALDSTEGEDGNGSITIDDPPFNITYDPGSTLSLDKTLFGHIDISYVKPRFAESVIIRYRETGVSNFKTEYDKESPFRLTNLKVGVSYQLKIAGKSVNGSIGPYSNLTTVTMPSDNVVMKAPFDAEYIVAALHPDLNKERRVVDTATTSWDISSPTQAKVNVIVDTSVQKVIVSKNGSVVATRQHLNFVEGSNIALGLTDDIGNNRVNIVISSSPFMATTMEVDVGSTLKWFGKFTITDTAISTSSKVLVWQAPGPYTGKGTLADEATMSKISCVAEALTGSATVYWETEAMFTSQILSKRGADSDGTTNPIIVNVSRRINRVRGNIKFTYIVF